MHIGGKDAYRREGCISEGRRQVHIGIRYIPLIISTWISRISQVYINNISTFGYLKYPDGVDVFRVIEVLEQSGGRLLSRVEGMSYDQQNTIHHIHCPTTTSKEEKEGASICVSLYNIASICVSLYNIASMCVPI